MVDEEAALADDAEEEIVVDDGAADEDTIEDELLRVDNVDEYPVDDGDADDVDEALVVETAGEVVVAAAVEVAADVLEERTEDGAVEDAAVEDEAVEELGRTGFAPVPGAWYISSLYGPPQNSDELPLQGILHPEKPSGARPLPPAKELPQSVESISYTSRMVNRRRDTHSTRLHIPHQRIYSCSGHMQLHKEPLSLIPPLQSSRPRLRECGSLDPCISFRVSEVDRINLADGRRNHGSLTYSIQLVSNRLVLDHARVLWKDFQTHSTCYYLRMLRRNCLSMPYYNPRLGLQ